MKHFKLFMLLALLVMGVSNVWGYTYRVFFEDGVIEGGYTVANTNVVSTGDNAHLLVSSVKITTDTYSRYITLNTVPENTASCSVSTDANAKQMGFDGIIYINYNSTATAHTTSDGVFTYSDIYQRDTYDRIKLPDNQYAISLTNLTTNTNVTIPRTYNGKRVTAIQKWGFCENVEDRNTTLKNCSDSRINRNYETDKENYYRGTGTTFTRTNSHSNKYLETVTFEANSNLLSIGDYAFMSCTKLVSINIPSSVVHLGQGLFEMDEKLKDVVFQTTNITRDGKTFRGVKFNTIRDYTFWLCTGIETLVLPDGIEYIEGQTSSGGDGETEGGGASLQYMTSLINIRLPNTLLRVGPHFLCSCSALRTVTIPVSVVYLDGACFHGCESLESVYVLGPAATLVAAQGSNANTFGPNYTTCADPVHDCTFYTTAANLPGYQDQTSVWRKIDNEGVWDVDVYNDWGTWKIDFNNSEFGNTLSAMGEQRTFPDHWVTALFPKGVTSKTTTFGANTLVAQMTACTGSSKEMIDGKQYRVYHLRFDLVNGDAIPENTPLLIKAGVEQTTPYEFYTTDDQKESWFAQNASIDFETVVSANDGAKIYMKGRYLLDQLAPGDFYFMHSENNGSHVYSFKRVPDQTNAPMMKGCRCWWSVEQDNMRSLNVSAKSASVSFFDDEATGIDELPTRVVVDAIYDLNGRKLNVKPEELPQGMFIMNGKKVIKK